MGYLLLLQSDVVLDICFLFSNLLLVLHQVLRHLAKLRLQSPPESNESPFANKPFVFAKLHQSQTQNIVGCVFADVGQGLVASTIPMFPYPE